MSSHAEIMRKPFLAARHEDAATLRKLIVDAIPVMGAQNFYFHLKLHDAAADGVARLKLRILEAKLTQSPVKLPSLVKHLETLRQALEGVPASDARTFEINDHKIRAASPEDALRIWAALYRPKAIGDPDLVDDSMVIAEHVTAAPFKAVLQSTRL